MGAWNKAWKRKKRVVLFLGPGVLLLLFWAYRLFPRTPAVAMATVTRGTFVEYQQFRGEAQARTSVTISAPSGAGNLQIIQLAANGSPVKKGEVVVQFDPTTLRQTLAQDRANLKAAQAEVEHSEAKASMKEEQDLTNVMKTRYDVQSAKLDASKQEILSKIAGEEAQLKLADAQQALQEALEKQADDRASDRADLEGKRQNRDKALYEVQQAGRSLGALTLRAPVNGLVTLMDNWSDSGPFDSPMPFKLGDRAWPGAAIAELPELSTIKIVARVDETKRGELRVGQSATVHIDAIPDRDFTGRISEISTIASTDFSAGWPFPRNFAMQIVLSSHDRRLRPGMSANVRIAVDKVPNGILVPAGAIFRKAGKDLAYVLNGAKFDAQRITVARRSQGQILVAAGLVPGERVALEDPTLKR